MFLERYGFNAQKTSRESIGQKEAIGHKPFEALVVLGKNWNQQRINEANQTHLYRDEPEFLLSRDSILSTIAAAELYIQGKTKRIIFSTGQTLEGLPSEAKAMRDHLRKFYVEEEIPDDAITLEDISIDTAGNAEHTARLLEGIDPKDVGLLTVGYHGKRSKRLFRNFGINIPDENVLASEKILGLEGGDPQRTTAKSIREHAVETGLNTLLYVDPYGKGLRRITTHVRK